MQNTTFALRKCKQPIVHRSTQDITSSYDHQSVCGRFFCF